MKSSIIHKEQINKFRVERVDFENIQSDKDLIEQLLERANISSEVELEKIRKLLDEYFLTRDENKEKQKKFVELFFEEVYKSKKISQSEKFLDFLIFKNISGAIRRNSGNIISSTSEIDFEKVESTYEEKENPRLILNEKSEIVAIEIDCKCGDTIRIDFEFSL